VSLVRRIHIDTDPGLDDLLAIAFALASPELEIQAITSVAGNACLEAVTDNTRRFLALAGCEVPVARGAAGPLALSSANAEWFHGADGRAGIDLPGVEPAELPDALDVMRHSLTERRVESVIALGPLTNLAQLVRQERDLFRAAEIVWMGGTLSEGNVTPAAEFNCYADPEAAAIVLGSGLPVRVIGLDVTRRVVVRPAALEHEPLGDSPVGVFLHQVLSTLMRAELPVLGEACAILHDPCAVAAAFTRDLFHYQSHKIEVTVAEGAERGRVTPRTDSDSPDILYADEVRSEDLIELFLGRLADWSRRCPEPR
jgi:inosine-uridine nucleoside N-ribohydrolase